MVCHRLTASAASAGLPMISPSNHRTESHPRTRTPTSDRIREATVLRETFEPRPGIEPDVHGWLATGEVDSSSTARIWVSPERARWAREDRRVVEELEDGAVIVERTYASHEWLAREILKEAGDAVVIEPDEARQAVLEAAEALAGAARR